MSKAIPAAAMLGIFAVFAGVIFWTTIREQKQAPPGPSNAPAIAPLATSQAVIDASQAALRADEPERGVAMLSSAIAQHPGDTELRLALAELLVRTGDHAAAADQFAEVIAAGDADAGTLYAAGSVARLAGQTERAIEWLAEASRREPANPNYAVHLGQARLAIGDSAAAKADLMRAVTLDEGLALAWGTLGEIHLQENDADIANDMARRARKLEPDVVAWRVIEARSLNRLGNPETALAVLRAAGPESARMDGVLSTRAASYGLLKQPGEAAEMYAEAGRPYDAALWFERAGDTAQATESAEAAVRGGDERARAILQRLANAAPSSTP